MRQIPSDLRQAFRRLATTPLLSLGAILILALGIGSAVVMVDVLDRLLLRAPAHITDPDHVARVYISYGPGHYGDRIAYSTVEVIATLRDELEATASYYQEPLSLGRGQHAQQLETLAHDADYFAVLGMQPAIGAWTDASNPTREDTAVISYRLWQQEFGGSADVLGKPLRLGVDTYTIVGVTPRGFAGLDGKPVDAWLPLRARAKAAYGASWKTTPVIFLQAITRVHFGVNRDRLNERATATLRATATQPWEKAATVVLGDLRPARAPGAPVGTRVEVLVAGVSMFVLLITCGNVANLLLVRGLRRSRELVIKTALGASRIRLLREVLFEAAVLACAAGTLALIVVATGGTLMRMLFLSRNATLAVPIDGRVILLTSVFCLVAGFLLGFAPALRLTTRRALSPGHSVEIRPSRLLDVFSGLQVALSLPMIVGAGLFVLSLWNTRHQDLGMQTDRVVVVRTDLFEVGRPMENHDIHRQLQARVSRLPQVEATALIQNMPMQSASMFFIEVPGRSVKGPVSSDALPVFSPVDPSFFAVMRMRLVTGRFFTDSDNRKGTPPVAVITETMARTYWPGERAIGKCFYAGDNACREVIGIVADARLAPSIRPTTEWSSACYVPIEQTNSASSRAMLVRTVDDPAGMLATLKRESHAAVADLPFVDVHAFDDIFVTMTRPWRLGSTVFVVFGALSMMIAAVGLAVVGAYGVTRRTREIGIRSALGAAPGQLVRLVLRRSLGVVITGLAIGTGLAWWGGRLVSAQLFNVSATDPRVLTVAALGLLVVGVCAAWLPARRAARIDPVVALRTE
jgi:putative ABC transport system permease protein